MLRIVALNEEVNAEQLDEDTIVTQEAQESIAESEYIRAIKFKGKGRDDVALSLLLELLDTKVLSAIPNDKNDKLLVIRYNCLKNIAFIYEDKKDHELAIKYYYLASNIDDTDVFTMHRFAELALKMNYLDLAEEAFEKCLKRNPYHFSAADGLLQVLCQKGNILGAYGYALEIYRRDRNNKRAINTIREVSVKFNHMMPFYKEFWTDVALTDFELKQVCADAVQESVFPIEDNAVNDNQKDENAPDLHEFRLKKPDWKSFGNYITSVYNYLQKNGYSMMFSFKLEDIIVDETIGSACGNESVTEVSEPLQEDITNNFNGNSNESEPNNKIELEMNPSPNGLSDVNNDDSDSNAKSDGTTETNKSKARRRCSDLLYLEQWGWHKNRRSNTRKKPQPDKPEVDMSLNGSLWRMLGQFKEKTFENFWPFNPSIAEEALIDPIKEQLCIGCKEELTVEAFQERTTAEFNEFMNEIKAKNIDLLYIIYKWLKYMSTFWKRRFPNVLRQLYLEVFYLYIKHFDISFWGQLPSTTYLNTYRICLCYVELQYADVQLGSDKLPLWRNIFQQLMYTSGTAYVIMSKDFYEYKLRLLNLKYLWFNHQRRIENCVSCLKIIEEVCNEHEESFILHVPNVGDECIRKSHAVNVRTKLERQVALEKLPNLFEMKNWNELVNIITDSIEHSTDQHKVESWLKDFKVQCELMLQSLYNMSKFDDCLIWAEKFLHYFVSCYLTDHRGSYFQRLMGSTINFIYSHIESIILNEGFEITSVLEDKLSRMVQNIINILCYHLDGSIDKNVVSGPDFDIKRPWIILHQIILKEEQKTPTPNNEEVEDDETHIPNSFLILFTAHEFLGKRQWCTKDNGEFLHYILDSVSINLRAPLFDDCRKMVFEYMEQVTYCLFGIPQKKGRSRHLEDHDSTLDTLTFQKAIQMFDMFRPDPLPDINSYKVESISSDMEQLILKIIGFMPAPFDPTEAAQKIIDFISGETDALPDESSVFELPYKINSIFYLMGDYYFKNRDFSKAIKYYTLDLACNPSRFDSWAGMALSKGNKIETKLNDLIPLTLESMIPELEDVIRCFEQCITINEKQILIWIEYGSFTYTIHSFCSRYLKHHSASLSMPQFSAAEERKERMLNIAYNCFSYAAQLQSEENQEAHDEKWLSQYMLGKIAEKRQLEPKVYLNHYLTAANHLYENNATYPIKINHNNPTTLSVEALEVFYRINAAIIKYLENKSSVSHRTGKLFKRVLNYLAGSPFAYNKAKIDGNTLNALKRKTSDKVDVPILDPKLQKIQAPEVGSTTSTNSAEDDTCKPSESENVETPNEVIENIAGQEEPSTSDATNTRRESQESAAGTTPTTTTATSSAVSSSDSSSSDDDSDSDSSVGERPNDKLCTAKQLDEIYQKVLQNLEECITRFPEHYKSIYRLVHHFMNGPANLCDLNRCEQLLLGQYSTTLGNQINGLFSDRKNNNIFNGIWRIPSSEIDRPGSFSAHLVKCIGILIRLLMKRNNHRLLIDIGLQLYKTPDNDKRYIKDNERMELYQQSINYCSQIIRTIFKNNTEKRDDIELLDLLIEIYKIHKKCVKYMNQKEPLFTQLLIEVYRFYIMDKVVDNIPDSLNYLDLAIKLCIQEISVQKNIEKTGASSQNIGEGVGGTFNNIIQSPLNVNRPVVIPGLRMWLKSNQSNTPNYNSNSKSMMYPPYVPRNLLASSFSSTNMATALFNDLVAKTNLLFPSSSIPGGLSLESPNETNILTEYYKRYLQAESFNLNSLFGGGSGLAQTQSTLPFANSLPQETTITPSFTQSKSSLNASPQATSNVDNKATIGLKLAEDCDRQLQCTISPTQSETIKQPSIFVKPLNSMQALPQSVQQIANISCTTDKTKKQQRQDGKVKSSGKNKTASNKPYGRGTPPISTNTPDLPNLKNVPIDTSILNKFAGEHLYQFSKCPPATNQRKVKEQVFSPYDAAAYPQLFKTFNFSSIDPNAVTVTTLPTPKNINSNMNLTPPPAAASPKTLQQKLAERQKSNQLNELAKPAVVTVTEDVIEIPD